MYEMQEEAAKTKKLYNYVFRVFVIGDRLRVWVSPPVGHARSIDTGLYLQELRFPVILEVSHSAPVISPVNFSTVHK